MLLFKSMIPDVGPGAEIPPELLPLIVNHIEDSSTLEACCLVSRAWRKWAQPRVFSRIWISRAADFIQWNTKFENFPHFASTVTRILLAPCPAEDAHFIFEDDLHSSDDEFVFYHDVSESVRELEIHYAESHLLPSRIADHLHSLESVKIMMSIIGLFHLLHLFFANPNLHSIAFHHIMVVPRKYNAEATRDGTRLAIQQGIDFLQSVAETVPVVRPLETLVLHNPLSDIVAIDCLMSSLFSLQNLHNLTLTWDALSAGHRQPWAKNAPVFEDLLRTAGPSVRSLELEGDLGYIKQDPCFNVLRDTDCLSYFKALRTLYLRDTRRNGSSLAIGLTMVHLLPLLEAPLLEEVTLKLQLRPSADQGLEQLSTCPEWAILDETLCRSRFACLGRIVILFDILEPLFFVTRRSELPDRGDEIKVAIASCLPRLSSNDRLRL
ncbi:hypothetical protein C8J56DRAFT_1170624 [Mycena floridula]|nr:hypothetical protein C8J56DRAFT_1170624 [Mycena floridula]